MQVIRIFSVVLQFLFYFWLCITIAPHSSKDHGVVVADTGGLSADAPPVFVALTSK